jgi:hypothetical protein
MCRCTLLGILTAQLMHAHPSLGVQKLLLPGVTSLSSISA